jgi:hypothetical protein
MHGAVDHGPVLSSAESRHVEAGELGRAEVELVRSRFEGCVLGWFEVAGSDAREGEQSGEQRAVVHGSVAGSIDRGDRTCPRLVSARVRCPMDLWVAAVLAGCGAPMADDVDPVADASTGEVVDVAADVDGSSSNGSDEGSTSDDPMRVSACGDASVLLCEDFDDPEAPLLGWARWVTSTAAILGIRDTTAVSAPASLEVHIDDADHLRVARAYRGVDIPPEVVDVTFSLRVAPTCFDGGAPVELAQVGVAAVEDPWALQLVATRGRVVVRTPLTVGSAALDDDAWHDVHIELDPIAGTIAVALDDKRFVAAAAASLPRTGGLLGLELGPRREATERGACTMHVDDVRVALRRDALTED